MSSQPMPAHKKPRKSSRAVSISRSDDAVSSGSSAAPAAASGSAGGSSVPGGATETAARRSGSARSGQRILLVDDDVEIVESMRTVLESRGYEILVARDGNQGLVMAEKEGPDLVVLDMMMPKRSGFLVLEKLRRGNPNPVRVIMITANEGSRHKAYAEMLGVDDYIRKPFAMDRLLASIDRLLGK
jgi:CheY-like chemotaxis protein